MPFSSLLIVFSKKSPTLVGNINRARRTMLDSFCGDKIDYQVYPKAIGSAIMHTSRPKGFHRPAQECEESLIIFLLKGGILVNSQEYAGMMLRVGEFILQAIGLKLKVLAMTDVKCVYYSFNQPELFCEQRYDYIMNEIPAPLIYSSLKIIPGLQYFLEGSKNCSSENKIYRELLLLKRKELDFILGYHYSGCDLSLLIRPFSQYTNSFRYFVLRNCMRVRTAEELAHMGGYSVAAFRRTFSTIFHEPAYEWMLKHRKEGIMYDLKHTNTTTLETCYKYGFESLPHFSNFYRKSFGASPRAIWNPRDKQLFYSQKVGIHPFRNTYIW